MTTANATLLEQFAQLSPEKRALIMAKLKVQGVDLAPNTSSQPAPLPLIDRTQPIPLSFPQEQLWFLQQFQPESVAYNERIALRLEGPLDVRALDAALQAVVQRHESLRTTFATIPAASPEPSAPTAAGLRAEAAGYAVQVIHPFVPHTYAIMQQSRETADDSAALGRWADAITRQPFDLTRGPLWRLALCAVGVDTHILLLVMHHIIADAWSIAIFLQEVAAGYTAFCQGKSPQWPALPVTYADFAGWQHQQLQGATLARHLEFWQQSLQGAPLLLQLPTDFPRPPVSSGRGSVQRFSLGQGLTQQLKALSRQAGATLYMTMLSALNLLLYRYTGQDDIIIGSVQANRAYPELEGLIGHFVNTLALRTRLPNQGSFRQLLQQVRQQMQASYEHQALPFQHIVQAIQPARSLGHHPIYQVSFNLHNQPGLASLSFSDLRVQPFLLENQTSKLDLYLLMYEEAEQLHGAFEYNCDLFAPATIQRMVGHFQTLLTGIVANPDQRLSDLPLLTAAERQQLLVEWNDTATDYPQDKCIHQLFEEQVERTPDAMAVIMAGGNEIARLSDGEIGQGDDQSPHLVISQSLTYRELNARANQLAHHLQSLGVGRLLGAETLVGICMDRSIEMVVSILAIFKAGGAYVPLDSNYPTERLAFMIQDAQLPIILTQYDLREKLTSLVSGESQPILISLDRDWQQIAFSVATNHDKNQGDATNVHATVTTDNLAYVIYTSGSTGKPKGVMVEHGSLTNLTCAAIERFHFHANSRVIQYASLSFDASLLEIVCPLCSGGQLYLPTPTQMIPGPDLAAFLQSARITYFQMPPAVLHILPKVDYPDLEVLMTIGDACTSDEIAFWSKQRYFCNGYGPTECTIGSISAEVMNRDHVPPIGRPFRNVQAYVLDHNRQPVPIGVPGELYLGGVQVARGYFKRPQLTAEKFVALDDLPIDLNRSSKEIDSVSPQIPLLRDKRRNLYKTGDLVRYLPNGDLDFIGRIDQMVKLRGIRIELGEIEAVLSQHPDVQEAVVIAREDTPGEKRLVAYVVPNKGTQWQASALSLPKDDKDRVAAAITLSPPHLVTLSALRRHLQAKLPDYMLPSAFVELERLPLTPNGKLDRHALPAPEYVDQQSEFVAPRTALEAQVAAIWQELLHVERLGVYDNFFALGGHSLLATQVIAKIQRVFAIELELSTLFASPTIAAQTQALLARQQEASAGASQTVAADRLPEIVHAPAQRHDPFPLTDVQYAYWVGRSAGFELGNVSAHIYVELEAEQLDVVRLNQAWQRLIERHETLRCIIQPDGQQRILPTVPRYEFALVNLQNVDESAATQTLGAIRAEMSHQILPADQWPLFDIRVTRLNPTSYRLHISLDALILDGTSIGTLLREWVELYQRPQTMLIPLTISFRDYVFAERTFEQSATYQRAWAYWQKRLPTLPPAPDLPLVQEAQVIQQPHFNMYRFQLAATAWSQLKRYGNEAGLTNSTIILSAFAEILTAWSKEPHYTLNLTLFNRLPLHPQINDILGDFTPLLLLEVDHRLQETGAETFATRAQRLQQQLWRDLDHRVVNGVRVLRELAKRQERGANRALMPVVFTSMLATPLDNTLLDPIGTLGYINSQTPQVWLDHVIIESAGALDLSWSVVEELFPAGMVADMFDAYCALLQRLATDETAWHTPTLITLPVVQQAQRQKVNDTTAPISDQMLHTLFLKQVDGYATAPAVITPKMTLTYAELYQRANQIGHWLRQAGAKPNTLVSVVMEKGWEQVVAVIGIHLAGAAYLPIDPDLPTERQHYLLSQGMVRLALTQSHVDTRLMWPQAITRLPVDTLMPDTSLPPLPIVQTPTDLAYVIYTSGSTGHPKGVVIDHRGAVNTVLDVNHRYGITANDRVLALSALNFDLSVYDIFGLLAVGGSIVMPDPECRTAPDHWHELIHQQQVTLWNTVPALMQMLVEYEEETRAGRALPSSPLRTIMMSGDWIPVTLPDRIRALYPAARIYSLGGATEASIWSIDYPIEKVDPTWPSIPYGKPMVNQTFHVLDTNLNPRPTWVPGNLYIGGIGLALGYWQDEARTNASFITHPQSGKRLYKTGDLGRYLPDGNIEFLGREDFQVKIRGHRIELGEIESALLQHPGINEAVVNAVGDPKVHRQLVGYVVLAEAWQAANQSKDADVVKQARPDVIDPQRTLDSATPPGKTQNTEQMESSSWQSELQAHLAKKLPAYMVPTTLIALPVLPLTANGKVDRKALPIPTVKATSTGKFTPPSTETEQLIANLWCELLGVQQVGIHDDFFALGGDSLIATQVRTRLRAATQLDLPLRTFFEHTTLYQLAEELEGYRVVHKMQASQITTNSVSAEIDREEVVW